MKTAQDVLTGLRAVVAGREDYVYESPDPSGANQCAYSTLTGEPSCGVGAYLFASNKNLFDQIHKMEWAEDEFSQPMLVREVDVNGLHERGYLEDFDEGARDLLSLFQSRQDRRETWGTALAYAEAEISERAGA